MNKMIKRLLCLAIALGVAVIPFTAAFAADKAEDKTMKEEYGSINQFMIKGLNISMQQKEDFKQKVLE